MSIEKPDFQVNKIEVLEAIDKLIQGYISNDLSHHTWGCPLCKTYRRDGECNNCLNQVFKGGDEYYPCTQRTVNYKGLDYAYDDSVEAEELYSTYENTHRNDSNLFKFWQEVRDLVKSTPIAYVNGLKPNFKLKMLEIAAKYK